MTKMRLRIVAVTAGILFCLLAIVAMAQDIKGKEGYLCVPIQDIELKAPEGFDATKNSVIFPHARHFVFNCTRCHHTWNLDEDFKTCMTSECHHLTRPPKKEKSAASDESIRYFKNAFHQQCIGCHQGIKKQNAALEKGLRISDKNLTLRKAGPTGCVDCHAGD